MIICNVCSKDCNSLRSFAMLIKHNPFNEDNHSLTQPSRLIDAPDSHDYNIF